MQVDQWLPAVELAKQTRQVDAAHATVRVDRANNVVRRSDSSDLTPADTVGCTACNRSAALVKLMFSGPVTRR